MANSKNTICLRLPADMYTAVVGMAEQSGVSLSEWGRDVMYRAIYGEPLGIEQGYREGRQLGFRMMQLKFQEAHETTPDTVEEAMQQIQHVAATRGRGRGR